MKTVGILASVFLCATQAHSGSVAAGHIPIAHQHPYDGAPYNSICWGFAQGRAFGKDVGDPDCDPAKTYIDRINENSFSFVAGSALTGIKYGDIVVFGNAPRNGLNGHAAFVISVPDPLTSQNR